MSEFASRANVVGKSSRTPFKHFLLNALLGREAGIYARCPRTVHAKAMPWHIVDMNAGDGVSGCNGETSSPQIILKHANYAASFGVSVKATLIERAEATFQRLVENTSGFHPFDIEVISADSRLYRVPRSGKHQAIFVHTDPNSLADWCVTPDVVATFSETTTLLATLGCNVGGLKRLPPEQRLCWFDHVRQITDAMPHYHDAVLVTIRRMLVNHKMQRDPSHWAYLIRVPRVWSGRVADAALSGAKRTDLEIELASLKESRDEFARITRDLFLTKSERSSCGEQAIA